MSYPVLTACLLIEASGAALNNAGNEAGQRLANAVVVKQIQVGRNKYPYVSGQAVRRWWREVLYSDYAWEASPVTRLAKSAYTQGDPIRYPDDDVFGYMAARKSTKKKGKVEAKEPVGESSLADDATEESGSAQDAGGTQKRVSPLKNSLLVSVLPNVITSDFGHFSRGLPVDLSDPVLYEHEHYSTVLQGVVSLSLSDLGRFECGPVRDLAKDTVVPDNVIVAMETDGVSQPRVLALSATERRKRAADTVDALRRLRHGANLTRNLSDVAPVVVLLGVLDGGNAPFQNLFMPIDGKVGLNLARLESVVKDYADRIMGEKTLYFGFHPGVLFNEAEVVARLGEGFNGVRFDIDSPGEAIRKVATLLRTGDLVPGSVG
jgi:CRISPR-associated protein Cst2